MGIARLPAPVLAALLSILAIGVRAEDLSGKLMTIVVPFTPGAVSDPLARMVAPKMADILGANVIVENKAGANTNIGTQYVAKSAPDGRTLLLGGTALATNVAIYKDKLPFDPIKDFAPISLVATSNSVLVVNPSLGVSTFAELVALAKSKPGQLNYASAGSGNMTHLGMEIIKARTGISINHVPYRGANPAITDVMAGHIPMMLISPGPVEQQIRDGKLRGLAVTGKNRLESLPDVPTFTELGLPMPEIDFGTWFGILAPAGTPPDLVELLNKAVVQALHDPDTVRRLAGAGFQPLTTTPEEYRAMLQSQIEKWQPVIDKAGITIN